MFWHEDQGGRTRSLDIELDSPEAIERDVEGKSLVRCHGDSAIGNDEHGIVRSRPRLDLLIGLECLKGYLMFL
jgi:hypothetical protein